MDIDTEQAVNGDGWIGMRMVDIRQTIVTCSQRQYVFAIRHGLSFSWVHPDDVGCVLSVVRDCCGGHRRAIIRPATVREARIWQFGGRGDETP